MFPKRILKIVTPEIIGDDSLQIIGAGAL